MYRLIQLNIGYPYPSKSKRGNKLTQFNPEIGQIDDLGHAIRRILAPNPSPMTFRGTNTYLVGKQSVAVIDPGPADPTHLNAILQATDMGRTITHICVTHAHLDHSPLAADLKQATGAPIYAFGRAKDGQSLFMKSIEDAGYTGGGEGIDFDFAPDVRLRDGDMIEGADWSLRTIHTPGHMSNHVCFALGDRLFSGDHVMDWATSMVSPPDGDLGDFIASCKKLITERWSTFYPGHGERVTDPNTRTQWLIDHRSERDREIRAALGQGPNTARAIATLVYTDLDPALLPAATRNVFAHLLDMCGKGLISFDNPLTADTIFTPKE